jgi:hypothetical protein
MVGRGVVFIGSDPLIGSTLGVHDLTCRPDEYSAVIGKRPIG